MTADAKIMECPVSVADLEFGSVRFCRPGSVLRDPRNAVMRGFVTTVTAANWHTGRYACVVTGDTLHCIEFAVTLVVKGYRAKLRR